MRKKIIFVRIASASLIGTVYAVALPWISFGGDIIIKICLSLIMVLVAYSHMNVKNYFCVLMVFYAITFALGGLIIGLSYMGKYELYNALIYPNSISVGLLAFVCILFTVLVKYIIHVCRYLILKKKYYYKVELSNKDKFVETVGYLDSGNRLYYHTMPVIIVDKEVIKQLYSDDEIESTKETIDINTINSSEKLKVYKLDYIKITDENKENVFDNIRVITSTRKLMDYKVLLHCDM